MSEAIEKYRGLEKTESTEDLARLFDDESEGSAQGQSEQKELTPERVAQVWEKLSDIEKKFVTCDQTQFDSVMPEYENRHGQNRAEIIKALRKLILSGDPRAGLIKT